MVGEKRVLGHAEAPRSYVGQVTILNCRSVGGERSYGARRCLGNCHRWYVTWQ